jgi:hypothetical protein
MILSALPMRGMCPNSIWVTILIALVTFGAGSCCTDKGCLGADNLDIIRFDHFEDDNLDTIVVMRFSKSTNFATTIDSTTVVNVNFSETTPFQQILLPVRLTTDYDYKVQLKSSGEVFTISDFTVKRESCNTGFMCNDSYNALESYKVNGKLTNSYQLEISR